MAAERRVSVGGADFWCRLDLDGWFWVLQGSGGQWRFPFCFAPGDPVVPERMYVPCDRAEAARVLGQVRQEMERERRDAPCGQSAC